MMSASIVFHDVSFGYETSTSPLLRGLRFHVPAGWTGVVGPNGVGKTTLLRLAVGQLVPWTGSIRAPDGNAVYCPQRTDDAPLDLRAFLAAMEADAHRLRGVLGVDGSWADRWSTLSHGERKRAQIGVALWKTPTVLALDEPTNHLDADARAQVILALRSFPGTGLLVSHDRELLDALCRRHLLLGPRGGTVRPGKLADAVAEEQRKGEARRRQRDVADAAHRRLRREASRRRDRASRDAGRRPKRGISPRDHDARDKVNRARVSGRDAVGGRQLRQLQGRLRQTAERRDRISVEKIYDLGIWLPDSVSRRDTLFRVPAGEIPLSDDRSLFVPDLDMQPQDRVALTGPNGAGKSTLIRHIVRHVAVAKERLVYLPQEIDLEATGRIMATARGLGDEALGRLMTVVSRLGSRPSRLLESDEPSPGEIRKVLLASGIAVGPHLIIMDEPTNHLDLPSIEALEAALDDCPCGLLLVSHDRRFLARLARRRWRIESAPRTRAPTAWILREE